MRRSGRGRSSSRGAVAAAVVLFLPVLAAALVALTCLGQAVWLRHIAFQAVDLGALAGAQALDLEQLAAGIVRLLPDEARTEATKYVRANISTAIGVTNLAGLDIQVRVVNPDGPDSSDPVTGRLLIHPTVCVVAQFPYRFRVGPVHWEQLVRAHADASVVPR